MVPGAEKARKMARRWELICMVGVGYCGYSETMRIYWTHDLIQLMLLNPAGAMKLAGTKVAIRDLRWGLTERPLSGVLAKEMMPFVLPM